MGEHKESRGNSEIPREELLIALHELADQLGEAPRQVDMDMHGRYSARTYHNRFGSWANALEVAGYSPRPVGSAPQITREDLLKELHRLSETTDKHLTSQDMHSRGKYILGPFVREFGSWTAALQEAGITPDNRGNEITDQELIEEMRRLSRELNKKPTVEDMKRDGRYSSMTYYNHFGSWEAARDASGL
jgi:hypothetical protein